MVLYNMCIVWMKLYILCLLITICFAVVLDLIIM